MNKFDATIIVLTYNSDYNKTISTLTSVIKQKFISFEIIIADDGSKNNNFERIDSFFHDSNFSNYKFIGDGSNRGTVSNLFNALKNAEGEYIKPISPGDYLYSNEILHDMIQLQRKSNASACFGKVIYYINQNDKMYYYPFNKHPYYTKPYIKQNPKKIRNNYLVLRDPILGAALLYQKDCLYKYIQIVNTKVKYCEDSVINLMAADYQKIVILEENVIFYEANSGISTQKDTKWNKAILKDNQLVFSYLLEKNLITKNEYLKSFPNNKIQRTLLTVCFCFFEYLKRRYDKRNIILEILPDSILLQMKNITNFNVD